MKKIFFYTTIKCPFCLKQDFNIIMKNLELPLHKKIEIVWDDIGDPRVNKLIQIYGNRVPLPNIIVEDDDTMESISGVYQSIIDNHILINSLLEED